MAKEDKRIDFESSLKELESVVDKLEDENINLEDSVKSFEKGINLVKECQKELQRSERLSVIFKTAKTQFPRKANSIERVTT